MADGFKFTKAQLLDALDAGKVKARELLADSGKLEKLLQDAEEKCSNVPTVGSELSKVPLLISMVRAHAAGEYTVAPTGTIVAIVSALLYVASPLDVIPDYIPIAGGMDDVAVIALCWGLARQDAEAYAAWRNEQGVYEPPED